MTAGSPNPGRLILASLLDPARTARVLLDLPLGQGMRWLALLLVSILNVLAMALLPGETGVHPLTGLPVSLAPLTSTLVLGAILVVTVFVLQFCAQTLGGRGELGGTILVVAWVECVALALRLAGLVLGLALGPATGSLVAILSIAATLWVMVSFLQVLHGFAGPGRAVAVLGLSMIGMGLGMAVILSLIRVAGTGGL